MMDFSLELDNVSFQYTGIGGSAQQVLKQINLKFERVECTAVIGPSGSGKTTLIQHFTGLLKPVSGMVKYNQRDIWQKPHRFAGIRRSIGLMFQFPETQLFEETVYKDIAFGPEKSGCTPEEIDSRVREAMDAIGLAFDDFAQRSPFKLSEGEKRRVAIAGILAMQPRMIVMDEPTAGLDPRGVRTIISIIDQLSKNNVSVVLITHNMELVARVADRVLVMNDGQLVSDTTPRELFNTPGIIEQAKLEIPRVINLLKDISKPLPKPDQVDPQVINLHNDLERIHKSCANSPK